MKEVKMNGQVGAAENIYNLVNDKMTILEQQGQWWYAHNTINTQLTWELWNGMLNLAMELIEIKQVMQ